MSDRVAFVGGATAGRDHFPFLVKDSSEATGFEKYYPISISLPILCKWFWRVRKWRVDGSITFAGVGLHHTQNVTWTISGVLTSSSFWRGDSGYREAFLVGLGEPGNDDDYTSVIDSSFMTPTQDQVFTVETDHFEFFCSNAILQLIAWQYDDDDNPLPKCLWDSGDFKPSIFLRLQFGGSYYHGSPGTDAGGATAYWNTDNVGGGTAGADQAIPIDGTDIPLKTHYDVLNSNFRLDFVSHNLVITPESFFEYENRDGFPIYDTSSGVELNSPIDAGQLLETITQDNVGLLETLNVKTDTNAWIPI